MKISILTLFPELFKDFVNTSIISHSLTKEINEIEIINFREYSKDPHKRVDDYQYGGGAGMVIGLQAIIDCLEDVKSKDSHVVLLSPQGVTYNQTIAKKFTINHDSLLCESFENNLLDYPVYTKPKNFRGYKVPEVLVSGNHQKIAQ